MGMWNNPTPEEIKKQIIAAGGKKVVAGELGKTVRAIDYWITGSRKIDFVNWKMICILSKKR